MREHACVNEAAVAFYDGSIHLVIDPRKQDWRLDVARSLRHEYTHHALNSHGVFEPVWLQEGLAIEMANDYPWPPQSLTLPGIALDEMSGGFPHTASPDYARRFYLQAFGMVMFLHVLCDGHQLCGDAALVEALTSSSTTPAELFAFSVQKMRPEGHESADALWQAYWAYMAERAREPQ
jgi:hypothetical protein